MKRVQYIVIDENDQVIMQSGINSSFIPIHSCAKPFQILPIFLLGLDTKYNLSKQELTIMSSSMLAQDMHVTTIIKLLDKLGIETDELSVASSAPYGQIAYRNWKQRRKAPSIIYNPCVGNHIAMFLAQRELTGSGTGYLRFDSPIQNMIFDIVQDFFGCGKDDIQISRDNCGAPCYSMTLKTLAYGYRNLCTDAQCDRNKYQFAIKKLRTAFNNCPRYLEGDGCLSTIISRKKGLIGKTGANGTLGISLNKPKCGMAIYSQDENWIAVAEVVS